MTDDLTRDVQALRAMRALDLIDPREVIGWATRMLERGLSEPALAGLAASSEDSSEVAGALEGLAEDLGLSPITERVAGIAAASEVARRMNEGLLEPIDAARQVWRIARLAPAAEPDLRPFIGLASEWDDDPEHRAFYEEEIRSLAVNLGKGDAMDPQSHTRRRPERHSQTPDTAHGRSPTCTDP